MMIVGIAIISATPATAAHTFAGSHVLTRSHTVRCSLTDAG